MKTLMQIIVFPFWITWFIFLFCFGMIIVTPFYYMIDGKWSIERVNDLENRFTKLTKWF